MAQNEAAQCVPCHTVFILQIQPSTDIRLLNIVYLVDISFFLLIFISSCPPRFMARILPIKYLIALIKGCSWHNHVCLISRLCEPDGAERNRPRKAHHHLQSLKTESFLKMDISLRRGLGLNAYPAKKQPIISYVGSTIRGLFMIFGLGR